VKARGAQAPNQRWWTDHPMEYDWRRTSLYEPGTREWFREIDQRFLDAAYFAKGRDGRPFSRFMKRELVENRDVLEIGCGMGTHAALLTELGGRLTAIDLTEPAVQMTKRRFEIFRLAGRIEQGDAEALPFEADSFDTVWSWGVLHHSSSFERCIAEVGRVLRPDGACVLMVYHRRSLFYYVHCGLVRGVFLGQLRNKSLGQIYHENIDGFYARLFTRAELKKLLEPLFQDISLTVAGEKGDLLPIPASRLKHRLKAVIPDHVARVALSRVGFLLIAEARRR
jgi:SAM-dependent methyltransferase